MQAGECELHLRLDAGRSGDPASVRVCRQMFQQSGLADSCLAAEDKHTTLPRAHSRDESLQHVALEDTVEQPRPWKVGVQHLSRSLSRPRVRFLMTTSQTTDLSSRCDLLRSLHRPGDPLLLPNAWDVASARAVVAAGFPVVATTSWGVAATLGHEDHADAPADEMLGAAARVARDVDAPVTVDVEAGYGMEPAELVDVLRSAGLAGCNLEDTGHSTGGLRDPDQQAEWLRASSRGRLERGLRARDQRSSGRFLRAMARWRREPGGARS